MGFNRFRVFVLIRVIVLFLTVATFVYLIFFDEKYVTTVVTGFIIIFEIFELFQFIESTNKKLKRFFDAIKYNDFNMSFTHDNKLGKTFKELNLAFKDVVDAILNERQKREEYYQQLNVVVENIGTGIISIDDEGEIGLINRAALRMLGLQNLRNVADLNIKSPAIAKTLDEMQATHRAIFKNNNGQELAILETLYKLGGKSFRLFAFQDIKAELQAKELEAWQNLTKVLRHEIMNSVAPISSLTSTLNQILDEDLIKNDDQNMLSDESLEDLNEGLSTISKRSQGLIEFVNAYRDYTSLPTPSKARVNINLLLKNTVGLVKSEFEAANIQLSFKAPKDELFHSIDEQLIEMVLINLIKNARESFTSSNNNHVIIEASKTNSNIIISIIDNGTGITEEAKEKIFMPFYSTKQRGSGIGLSLSSQIMQMHNGEIQLVSEIGKGSTFKLIFYP
jgi:nitrogen fixation/metabolism regulation signal transduction histidine kinase